MHACGLARTTVALAYIITGQANGGLLMHSTWQRMRRPHATPSLTSACFFMRWASVPAATRLMVHAHHVNNNHAAGHDAAVAGASMFQMAASPFLQAVLPLATPPPPYPHLAPSRQSSRRHLGAAGRPPGQRWRPCLHSTAHHMHVSLASPQLEASAAGQQCSYGESAPKLHGSADSPGMDVGHLEPFTSSTTRS